MKLQLSVFGQGLKVACHPYAVVTNLSDDNHSIMGQTETLLHSTLNPDWAKIFILENFNLGKTMLVKVDIYDDERKELLCTANFDIGVVLGTKGGILGKETQSGTIIMAQVERCSGTGILNLNLRGIDLKHKEGRMVDPFFELQRKQKTISGDTVWDCVYRSKPVLDNPNPIWDLCCIELSTLCQSNKDQYFRIAMKDFNENDGKPSLIGFTKTSVNELLNCAINDNNPSDKVMNEKALNVIKGKDRKQVGKLVVTNASITGEESTSASQGLSRGIDDGVDEDIIVEATDDVVIVADELEGGPNFADYISGGCQLRLVVAIDYTASNGDPRKESSLHHFNDNGTNVYEQAMSEICTVLAEYDSDQKIPVYGFGAKKDGKLNNCFQCGETEEVHGVIGILEAYKHAFKSGIAMSHPTNICDVIETSGKVAGEHLADAQKSGNQQYSILCIFTNSNVHSVEATTAALKGVQDAPLSILVVGVGEGNFSGMKFLNDFKRVQFVEMESIKNGSLANETLRPIPEQLVEYFLSKGIQPNNPIEPDEVVIEPYNAETEQQQQQQQKPDKKSQYLEQAKKEGKRQFMRQGKKLVYQQTRKIFGRTGRRGRLPTKQQMLDKLVDKQVNKLTKLVF